ncbi:MAG: hypothetical protein ABI323_14675 [Solirubrobacteraceae bacterium]
MTDFLSADPPLEIDRVHGSRPSAGEIRLVLSGSWRGDVADPGDEPLLVVQLEGRRHRFPAEHDQRAAEVPVGRWRATFAVPDWAEPRHEGQAAVWIGNSVVPVPPLHGPHHAPPTRRGAMPAPEVSRPPFPRTEPGSEVEAEVRQLEPLVEDQDRTSTGEPSEAVPDRLESIVPLEETPRSGPLADLLLKETVGALHAELEVRTAEATRLRAALGDARSELEARLATQSGLEGTLAELGIEVKRLMTAVEDQRSEIDAQTRELAGVRAELSEALAATGARDDELRRAHAEADLARSRAEQRTAESIALREELAASQVAREAALTEVVALQGELSRVGGELAVTRERVSSESGDLGEANRLLADARALTEELRRERDGG